MPPVLQLYTGRTDNHTVLTADPTPTPVTETENTFRILDTANNTVLHVSEKDFLPIALLCEMSPDLPEEALKAQTVAIRTHYRRLSRMNTDSAYHFTCNTESCTVYTEKEQLCERYGDEWNSVLERAEQLCAKTENECLYYENELITAPFFAISAGSTQPNENVWSGEALPYLRGTACPSDMLHSKFTAVKTVSPEELRAAFPAVSFSDAPEAWFSEPQLYPSGYVKEISLCGTAYTGVEVRTALSLRSAAFSVIFSDGVFQFTTHGYGHGVGMSQAGAVYLAEQGESYSDILSFFYPGTMLKTEK